MLAKKNRSLILPLAALAAAAAVAGWPAAAQRYSEVTEVVAVEIPVQVVRDGEAVRGLTADDFEVLEGRKKLKITDFDVIDLTTATGERAAAGAELPTAARRHFLFLFDLTFSEPKAILKARDAAKDLLAKGLHPTDLVAVATYSLAQGPQLVLGFSADRRQAETAIETLGSSKLIERTADPLRLVVVDERSRQLVRDSVGGSGDSANKEEARNERDAALLDQLGSLAESAERADRENRKARITAMTRSLADLAKLMSSVEGRKHVVYLSEGFDSSLLTGVTGTTAGEIEGLAVERSSNEPYLSDSEERYGSTQTGNDVQKMLEEFRRADCVIQAVDIGGLRAGADITGAKASGQEALLLMAKDTGGDLYERFNDLSVAMGQMLHRTSVTYVLTVQPEDIKLDGAYRRLKVQLKNGRGMRVVHRPGYYAPKPYAQQNPLERLLDTADALMGEERGAIPLAVLGAPFRADGDRAYVPVLIEIDGPGLLAGHQGDSLPTEIYVYAIEEKGAIADFFTQTMGLELTKVGQALQQSGLKFFGHLDLPPGNYSVRVLVKNGKTGAYALSALPVEVPAFAQAGPVLLPPFFPEPAGRWLTVREQPRGEQKDVPYPFMMEQNPYIPASRPVLGSGQDAAMSLVAYNLGAGEVKATAKVMGRDGKDMGAGQLTILGREKDGPAGPDRLKASFRPPQLQPGEYTLEVTLTDAGTGKAETSSIPFVVKG